MTLLRHIGGKLPAFKPRYVPDIPGSRGGGGGKQMTGALRQRISDVGTHL